MWRGGGGGGWSGGVELVRSLRETVVPVLCPSPLCYEQWTARNPTTCCAADLVDFAKKVLDDSDRKFTIRFEIDAEDNSE